jgi:hypothetical protein
LKAEGAWSLASLRQSFLNGSLTRLIDPDSVLKGKIVEFVERGDFGLASVKKPDGGFERLWFQELMAADEVTFEAGVFLLRKAVAESLKSGKPTSPTKEPEPPMGPELPQPPAPDPRIPPEPVPPTSSRTLRLTGAIPPEIWNRLGTRIIPKLRSGSELRIGLDFSVTMAADSANNLAGELRQILQELGLADSVKVE